MAQGLFAVAGEYKVYMRLSTNAGDILTDAISLPRGLALKVLDVKGERLPDADGTTQDFVMVNGPVFQAKTADKFLGSLKLLAKTTDVAEGGKAGALVRDARRQHRAGDGGNPEHNGAVAWRRPEHRPARRDLL